MRMRFFKIPAHGGPEEDALNRILASERVLTVDRQFIAAGDASAWAICVSVLEGEDRAPLRKGKVDYREVLSEADFTAFAKLRSLRKTLAEREGVPAYALFTNDQLAEMVRRRVSTQAELARIEGVGEARIAKYGKLFLDVLRSVPPGVENSETHDET